MKRLHFLGYIIAGVAAVPLTILGFAAWRDEGFFVPGKLSALSGRGGGFWMFILAISLIGYSAIGLHFHFSKSGRSGSGTSPDNTPTIMLLVIDRDNIVGIYRSVSEAEANLETIDVELGEYEFCDETGQPYVGEVLETVEKFRRGAFRLVPRGMPDPALPKTFLSRAVECHSKLTGVKTLQEARAYFGAQQT